MTQPKPATITREQLDAVKRYKFENIPIPQLAAFHALITMAEPIVAGTHVVVPREPTEEMAKIVSEDFDDTWRVKQIYRAFIAAVNAPNNAPNTVK